jgi:F-type H+-transporting ATPase subunit b
LKHASNSYLKICAAVLILAALFAPVPRLHAQTSTPRITSKAEKVDAPETNKELEAFRHAPAVQSLANHFHVSVEFMAKLLEDLNSAILIAAILWFLFRMVPKMYRRRTETLQKQIFDARLATSEANEKLAAIEERLSKLGTEIDEIRQQTERDSANDEQRIHESLEAERQRLVASVEQEIEAAGGAARRDLKKYAASLAIERAMAEIRLTEEDDRILVRSFGNDLSGERN